MLVTGERHHWVSGWIFLKLWEVPSRPNEKTQSHRGVQSRLSYFFSVCVLFTALC